MPSRRSPRIWSKRQLSDPQIRRKRPNCETPRLLELCEGLATTAWHLKSCRRSWIITPNSRSLLPGRASPEPYIGFAHTDLGKTARPRSFLPPSEGAKTCRCYSRRGRLSSSSARARGDQLFSRRRSHSCATSPALFWVVSNQLGSPPAARINFPHALNAPGDLCGRPACGRALGRRRRRRRPCRRRPGGRARRSDR
jgi:hypothetical protein